MFVSADKGINARILYKLSPADNPRLWRISDTGEQSADSVC